MSPSTSRCRSSPPPAVSCDQPPSHDPQGRGSGTCPLSPPPRYERATRGLGSHRLSPRATTHRFRGAECVHSLLRAATSKLHQPAHPKHHLGQAPLGMTHLSLGKARQPGTNLSSPLIRTKKIMVTHGRLGRFWSCPRSRRRWSSRLRSGLRRRSRCLLSSRSSFLSVSRLGFPPPPLRSWDCRHQDQRPAAASITDAKVTTAFKARIPAVSKVKILLRSNSKGSRLWPTPRLRSGCLQGQGPVAAIITEVKVKVQLPSPPTKSRSCLRHHH